MDRLQEPFVSPWSQRYDRKMDPFGDELAVALELDEDSHPKCPVCDKRVSVVGPISRDKEFQFWGCSECQRETYESELEAKRYWAEVQAKTGAVA